MENWTKQFPPIAASKGSYLISFEGIEGAGKTTQIQKIKQYLSTLGKEVHLFREPGATELGEKLRSLILGQTHPLHPLTEAMIFAAARVELIEQKLRPILLKENQVVLLDRFVDSSFAYQGVARGLGIQAIQHLHALAPLNSFPHITFYLSISIETSLERQKARGSEKDYFEKENNSFHKKLKQGFDEVAALWPERVKIIDANKNQEEVFEQLKLQLQKVLQ